MKGLKTFTCGLYFLATTLFLFSSLSKAAVYEYKDVPLENLYLKYRSGYMYSESDAPALSIDNPQAFIKFDLTFTLLKPNIDNLKDNFVQITIFSADDEGFAVKTDTVNFYLSSLSFCCNEDQTQSKEDKQCTRKNDLYSPVLNFPSAKTFNFNFEYNDVELDYDDNNNAFVEIDAQASFSVSHKGLYYIVFSYCQKESQTVFINGHVTWRNPFGYIPAELYGFIPFFLDLSLFHIAISLVWFFISCKNWRSLSLLQNMISFVLILANIELLLRYADLHSLNETGKRDHSLMLFSLLFLALKKTVSRALVLSASLGLGVTKPTLQPHTQRIFLISVTFFITTFADSLIANLSSSSLYFSSENSASSSYNLARTLLQVPLAAIDTYIYLWIFKALNVTIASLDKSNKQNKVQLFNRFWNLLVANVALGIMLALGTIFVRMRSGSDEGHWERMWWLECGWDLLYSFALIGVVILFRPQSQNAAYQRIRGDSEDSEEEFGRFENDIGDYKIKMRNGENLSGRTENGPSDKE